MTFPETISSYISQEESSYQTRRVDIFDNFSWNMAEHIQTCLSFKYGKFLHASNELKFKSPFRNVTMKNLRLRYTAEDFDVKNVDLYIEDPQFHHLSFLIKKYYYDVFVIEHNLDKFFDDSKESHIDTGLALVKKGQGPLPEVINLQEIAFCDQTDVLGGPIGLKFEFSPAGLRAKAKLGWGDESKGATISIEELIVKADNKKDSGQSQHKNKNQTPGKNIEVYIVRGNLPETYLDDKGDNEELVNMVVIEAFYHDEEGRQSVTLFKQKEVENVFKKHTAEEVHKRACGLGGCEELVDAQIWSNFAEFHKTNMLKAASKIVLQTDDEALTNRNKVRDMENLEIITTADGKSISQIPTGSPNIQLFNEALINWDNYAQDVSGATDALLGKPPPAGSPFALQKLVVQEGKKPHEYRRGKFAKFQEEIHRDWIIPHIVREITKGKKFLSSLSGDEMIWLMDKVAFNRVVKRQWEDILNGREPEDRETAVQLEKENLLRGGNKVFLELIKNELKGVEIKIKINIAGKQEDLVELAGKTVDVLRQFLATPQLRQDPFALKLVSKVLEFAGMSPEDLASLTAIPVEAAPESATKPLKELAEPQKV